MKEFLYSGEVRQELQITPGQMRKFIAAGLLTPLYFDPAECTARHKPSPSRPRSWPLYARAEIQMLRLAFSTTNPTPDHERNTHSD